MEAVMFKYKLNEDAQHLEGTFVPGAGVVRNGILTSGHKIENPNFVPIQDTQVEQAPQHLNGVTPQATQPVPEQPVQPEQHQQTPLESESQS
jgi:hypothetical protein